MWSWSIHEMKEIGKSAFKVNYWRCVLVAFLLSLLVGGTSAVTSNETGNSYRYYHAIGGGQNISSEEDSVMEDMRDTWDSMPPIRRHAFVIGNGIFVLFMMVLGFVLKIFLFNPLQVGGYAFFRKNIEDAPAELGVVASGFKNYGHTFLTLFLRDIFLILWSMLFLIPGIVKAYSYRMVPYIIEEEPELSATQVITRSRRMMTGNKGKLFLMDLSFIGWLFLGLLTCGIVQVLWTAPYQRSAEAALYERLKELN